MTLAGQQGVTRDDGNRSGQPAEQLGSDPANGLGSGLVNQLGSAPAGKRRSPPLLAIKVLGVAAGGMVALKLILPLPYAIFLALGFSSGLNAEAEVLRAFHSDAFKELHTKVVRLAGVHNLAVLKENEVVVVDGTVIDLDDQTWGEEPDLGFYAEYYEAAKKNRYSSLSGLLAERGFELSETGLLYDTDLMRKTGVNDICWRPFGLVYSWNASAMWGSNGVIYCGEGQALEFDYGWPRVLERIADHFYYFSRD